MLGGMISNLLGTQLPGRGTMWLKQRYGFPAPANVGEAITARVKITRMRPEKDLVYLSVSCRNPQGEVVCRGETLVFVADLELTRS
jgi:acyl dehydratase